MILRNHSLGMEEQFILRVPPSIAERIERLLNENSSSSEDKSLDLSFSGENGIYFFVFEVLSCFPKVKFALFQDNSERKVAFKMLIKESFFLLYFHLIEQ